ncbi:hypothetical protein F5B20DRAFT_590238 [Whalleya microplaca]|nr:hypothetical protein F5B20DRAFT_590238 [Whalleya microplaca]
MKLSYDSLADFLQPTPKAALRYPDCEDHITHQALHDFVQGFNVPVSNRGSLKKPVLAIVLPNGPLLAATVLAAATWYTAAPINPAAGVEQVTADVALSGASAIISCLTEARKLRLHEWGLDVFLVAQSNEGCIQLETTIATSPTTEATPVANRSDEIGIILFTSGTSGNKKVVPMTIQSIVSGVGFVIKSWALESSDICLNMMPLYHVGGLIRNIFAPIFSGGSTICCQGFDANLFWDVTESMQPTWYYASPSMHSVILELAGSRSRALSKSQIRLICNAAGGLLPALASQLRDTFQCTVLPSYGMTECMPISTPLIDYKLDRPGTSGISVGPELRIMDGSDREAPAETVGRICVRGEPTFRGYLRPDGSLDTSALMADGWFDTGDMGYMDQDGYLYITGRNKEVINRGGELISPFEIENAIVAAAERNTSAIFGRVSQALAFSVRHDVLQEVVGVVLVTPRGKPKVDLRLLHECLKSSLQQAKWPVLLVYMDDIPKKNNKVLRIKLGERLGLPCIDDTTPYDKRHWEARCPLPDTDLSVAIPTTTCQIQETDVLRSIRSLIHTGIDVLVERNHQLGTLELLVAPSLGQSAVIDNDLICSLKADLSNVVDGYLVPHKITAMPQPLPRDEKGNFDMGMLHKQLEETRNLLSTKLASSTEGRITQIFADILLLGVEGIDPQKDFLELGGDSLRAGKLLSALRTEFQIHLPIDLIFSDGSVNRLSTYINNELSRQTTEEPGSDAAEPLGCHNTYSSTNPLLLFLQITPIVIFYPLSRALRWTLFVYALNYSRGLPTNANTMGRLLNFVVSMFVGRIVTKLVLPLVGITLKWLIIGRHKEGLYPMWGLYHTRWWMTQKILDICGKGFFNTTSWLEIFYYRLLGAKIGRGVTIKNTQLGEWDLLNIGDGVTLDGCTVRPMAGERNTTMYLGKIEIGRNASVGISSVVAPGANIPENTCIGPNSSSWEIEDATEANRDLSATKAPGSHWALTGFGTAPLSLLAKFLYVLPWLLGLLGLVAQNPPVGHSTIVDTLNWFTGGERVGYHYLARALRTFIGPFFIFTFVVLVKKLLDLLFGPLESSHVREQGEIEKWRKVLMRTLMPVPVLHELTGLFGQHYEATSVAIRMLGGKAGRHIYWPGTGPSIGDYHLIDVGNNVVFGSRSHLITSDGIGSDTIRIRDGAMIADRVVMLPGVTVEKNTIMGSGALTRREKTYEAGGTYVGSKGGDSLCLVRGHLDEKTSSKSAKSINDNASDTNTDETSFTCLNSYSELDGKSEKPSPCVVEVKGVKSRTVSNSTISNLSVQSGVPHTSITRSTMDVERGKPLSRPLASKLLPGRFWKTKRAIPYCDHDNSMSPFGRAFYQHRAPYYVWRPWHIFLYSSIIIVFVHLFWDASTISAIQLIMAIMNQFPIALVENNADTQVFVVFGLFTGLMSILIIIQVVAALGTLIAAKWILLGRRHPGNYDWDKSSYCQRWQLFLTMEKLRQRCLGGHGILNFLTGTAYMVWYFRALGANIGKDCALFVNGKPSLMFTEPDLLTLGDRVVVDNASLVGHINTRGKFDLNRLCVGDRSVLRSNSRLLSGAEMGPDSCLLEHTLIMGGDFVGKGETMQGWPASRFRGKRAVNIGRK